MNQSKVQSRGNVPFSWENKPGVCKETSQEGSEKDYIVQKLPPQPSPSCRPESVRMSIRDIRILLPPPPCAFHPPSRTYSRRGLLKSDDPFLAAYKVCTKSTSKPKLAKMDGGSGLKKGMFNFSCKQSCSFRNDNLVPISQLTPERDRSGIKMWDKSRNCL